MNETLSGSISALSSRRYKKRRFSTVWLSVDFTKEPSQQPTKKIQPNYKISLWKRLNVAPQNLLKSTPISDKLSKGKRNSKILKVLLTSGRNKIEKTTSWKHYHSLAVTEDSLPLYAYLLNCGTRAITAPLKKSTQIIFPHLTLWKRRQSASK